MTTWTWSFMLVCYDATLDSKYSSREPISLITFLSSSTFLLSSSFSCSSFLLIYFWSEDVIGFGLAPRPCIYPEHFSPNTSSNLWSLVVPSSIGCDSNFRSFSYISKWIKMSIIIYIDFQWSQINPTIFLLAKLSSKPQVSLRRQVPSLKITLPLHKWIHKDISLWKQIDSKCWKFSHYHNLFEQMPLSHWHVQFFVLPYSPCLSCSFSTLRKLHIRSNKHKNGTLEMHYKS